MPSRGIILLLFKAQTEHSRFFFIYTANNITKECSHLCYEDTCSRKGKLITLCHDCRELN